MQQTESLSAQVFSLTKLLAETGMAELQADDWADLRAARRCQRTKGRFTVNSPWRPEESDQRVILAWQPGNILLSESYHATSENTLTLPLPPVRETVFWMLPSPQPDQLPPLPPPWPADLPIPPEKSQERSQQETVRTRAWTTHLAPWLEEARHTQEEMLTAALADERRLAVEAVREIQARRADPQGAENTLIEILETLAAQMRAQAHGLGENASGEQ